MVDEEQQMRVAFNEAHGDYLPVDVCLSIANLPTRWRVVPEGEGGEEEAVDVDADILNEVRILRDFLWWWMADNYVYDRL